MARAPRASVSKTSGQGVSRLAYQQRYQLTRGDAPQVKMGQATPNRGREYGKGTSKSGVRTSMNVSYGDTVEPSDLQDIRRMFTESMKRRRT